MANFNIDILPLISPTELQSPKTLQIIQAIGKNNDFEIIEFRKLGEEALIEIIVVEFTCDDVPDQNSHGFEYREKLGIAVSKGERSIPDVWPLREDFPVVLHMMVPDHPIFPTNLCLYVSA